MAQEIKWIMDNLGYRYDQAVRLVRQREEIARSGYRGNSNWLK